MKDDTDRPKNEVTIQQSIEKALPGMIETRAKNSRTHNEICSFSTGLQ